MNLFELSRRILRTARKQGKHLWEDVEREWESIAPHVRAMGQGLRTRSVQFRNQVSNEILRWLEDELRISIGQWRVLLGQDPDLEKAYKVLNLPYGTELNEVKQQWRELLKEHHPDRHMSTPHEQAIATQKSQVLTAAYHRIEKAFREHQL